MIISPISRSSNSYYIQPITRVQNTSVADNINVVKTNSQEQVNVQENVASVNNQRAKTTDKATAVANAQNILSAQINQNVFDKIQNNSNEDDNIAINNEQENITTTEDEQNVNNISTNTNGKKEVTLDSINNTLEEIRDQLLSVTDSSTNDHREFSQNQINELLQKLESDLEKIDIGYDIEDLELTEIDVTDNASIHNSLKSIDNAIELISYKEEHPLGLSNSTVNSVANDLEKLYALGTTASETNISGYKELLQEEIEKVKTSIEDTLEGTSVTLEDLGIEDFDVTEKFSLDTIHNAMEEITNKQSTLGQGSNIGDEEYINDRINNNKENANIDMSAWNEVLKKFSNFSKNYQYQNDLNILNLFSGENSQVAPTFNMLS